MANILLVEDDADIRQIEADYLKREGYKVTEAENGQLALDLFYKKTYDLIILDLNLPLLDGTSVCRAIRKESGIPIIMVTARTSEIDELLGLDIGADDYVKKPFSPKVLVARAKALLKRPQLADTDSRIILGPIEIDNETRMVTRNGRPVNVTATQFNMLFMLMSHPGKVYTREDLIEHGYQKDLPPDIYDRTIDSHIKNLRKAIEDKPDNPKYIVTVRGHGYKFNYSNPTTGIAKALEKLPFGRT